MARVFPGEIKANVLRLVPTLVKYLCYLFLKHNSLKLDSQCKSHNRIIVRS